MSVDRISRWRRDLPNPKNVGVLDLVRWTFILIFASVIVTPVAYAFMVSFRPRSEMFGALHFIPYEPTLEPWVTFFDEASRYLLNSLMVATGVSLLVLVIAIPGSYAFARLEFDGRKALFYAIVMIVLVPEVMLIIPVAQIIRWLNLYDTLSGVWIALIIGAMPITVWILRDNFMKLPANAEECAQIYGCTQFSAFLRVVLPLAGPAILTVAFLAFLGAWTEFLFTNLLTTPNQAWTGIIVLFDMLDPDQPVNWPRLMAGSFILSAPPIVFYALIRRSLEQALSF